MKLDFTAIREENKPQNSPILPLLEQEPRTIALNLEKPLNKLTEPNNRAEEKAAALKRLYDAEQADHERTWEVYSTYQSNIKKSEMQQIEILKGTAAGEGVYSLFLKACNTISLMTGNKAFYSQIEERVKRVYGAGLLEAEPLEIDLREVEQRLYNLTRAAAVETEPADKQRIDRAIEQHNIRAAAIRKQIIK